MSEYSFGECKICKIIRPLKNGYCLYCEKIEKENLWKIIFEDIYDKENEKGI